MAARGPESRGLRGAWRASMARDKLWTFAGDMRDPATIEDALSKCEEAEFGPIWGAVANVGLHPCPPGFEVDDETWDAGFSQIWIRPSVWPARR